MATYTDNTTKELVSLRVARTVTNEIRDIAARESETQATIIRRLLRAGLELERRAVKAE